ncbi:VOC family protein [Nocardioides sp. AE5]|uniref:VOC family protein n=1 Tax=Nocardioides sp. AE5 TaxID=2962573 RepID=UPI002881EA0D|nr:VOC family protein [Nocardioides sp. AE5]MDT0200411.1 VOC family protein [Nocardioides sp. AE5]
MSGRVVHFELPYVDGERARSFYAEAFGWEVTEAGRGYMHAVTGPSEDFEPTGPGYVNGGLLRSEGPGQGPIIVIEVDDLEASLAKVVDLGATVILPATKAGDSGSAAYIKDVEGNIVSLWQRP